MSLPPDRSSTPAPSDPPWGVPATLAWGLLALLLGLTVAGLVLGFWPEGRARLKSNSYDGVVLAFSTFVWVPVMTALLVFAAQKRRWPPALYLGLIVPRRAEIIVAVIAVLALAFTFDAMLWVGGRDIVPPFQVEIWRTAAAAGSLPALLLATIVVAPIGEEIAFRGFLFRGLALPGYELWAIAGIALAWSLLHIQYDWLTMFQIFVAGLVLGWFRWVTGSTILAIGMHVLINLQSMIETWIKVEYFP